MQLYTAEAIYLIRECWTLSLGLGKPAHPATKWVGQVGHAPI